MFDTSSIYILMVVSLPLIINKRQIYFLFGILYMLIWLYVGMAILIKGLYDPIAIVVMPIVTVLALFCSMLMIYSGITISEKKFSLL